MKQVIKRIFFTLLTVAVLAPMSLLAQDTKGDKGDKGDKGGKGEKVKDKKSEQIIIKRNTDEKIIVEVDGDKVTVNGKPIEDYKGDDVMVLHNKIKDLSAFNYGQSFDDHGYRAFTIDANRAMLGVITDKTDKGAEVTEVTKGSGAEKAGIKKGDIITTIDDTKIESPDDLSKAIKAHKPGDKVGVSYLRDNKKEKVTAELTKWKGANVFAFGDGGQNFEMAMPDMDFERMMPRAYSAPRFNYTWSGGNPKMGLSIQDTEDGKGVKVIEVDEESNAAKAGIKEDDVITEVDGQAIKSTDEIAKIIKDSKDKVSVKMKLLRNGKAETVEVKIPRKLKTTDL